MEILILEKGDSMRIKIAATEHLLYTYRREYFLRGKYRFLHSSSLCFVASHNFLACAVFMQHGSTTHQG
jgi:hypothetical protein